MLFALNLVNFLRDFAQDSYLPVPRITSVARTSTPCVPTMIDTNTNLLNNINDNVFDISDSPESSLILNVSRLNDDLLSGVGGVTQSDGSYPSPKNIVSTTPNSTFTESCSSKNVSRRTVTKGSSYSNELTNSKPVVPLKKTPSLSLKLQNNSPKSTTPMKIPTLVTQRTTRSNTSSFAKKKVTSHLS